MLGENGAGKSTLINVIAGNYIPDEGKIYVQGQETTFLKPDDALKHGVAVVYQELNVVDTLSIAENVFYGHLPQNSCGLIRWKKLYRSQSNGLYVEHSSQTDGRNHACLRQESVHTHF